MNAINHFHESILPSLEVVTTLDEFQQLRDDWNSLTKDPLQSFEWNFAWWKSFQHEGKLRLFVMKVGDVTLGIAPLFEDRWLGQQRLRFLGSGKTCTDYTGFILSEAWHKEFAAQFSSVVDTSCSIIELEGVGDSDEFEDLSKSTEGRFWKEQEVLDQAWLLSLPKTWEEFKACSKKSLRRKIKKAEKRLASESVTIQSTLDDKLCPDEAWRLLVELHQSRFESKGKAGAFADPAFESFLKNAFIELSRDGRSEIIVATHEGEPIGAHLYFFGDNGPQLYQAGIQVEKIALEPGHLLITHAVKRSIERGYRNLDFLRGTEKYKSYWGAKPTDIHRIRFVSRAMLPSTAVCCHNTLRKFRQATRNFRESGRISSTSSA